MFSGRRVFLLTSLLLAVTIFAGIVWATPLQASFEKQEEQPLRVVTKQIPPFVLKDQDRLTGFSIDLWKEIALISEFSFEFIEVETVADQLDALTNDEADVAIAAISMTPEREKDFDFSYPYYRSGLQIMTSSQTTSIFFPLVAVVLSPNFLAVVGALLLIMLFVGHIVWFLERKRNPDFPHSYLPGVWEGLWWSAVTVTTVGYGDKTVKDVPGRILGMIWMFAGLFLIANFTAAITAELTLTELQSGIGGPEDLPGKKVVTVAGTTSTEYLTQERIPFRAVEVIEEAYNLLEQGQIDAVVYDAPVLQYYAATQGDGDVAVVGTPFVREDYGIALPPGSPHEEAINQALLEIKTAGTFEEIANRWFIHED